MVAGGGQVYAQALPLADRLELTHVDAEPDGDTRFPEYDETRWHEVSRDVRDSCVFATYRRRVGS
jgi:dihydrofolate reductase